MFPPAKYRSKGRSKIDAARSFHSGGSSPAVGRLGRRLHGVGAQKVTWAYALSGVIALALLVYLVVALFRAEDL